MTRAIDRLTRRGRAAAASAPGAGVLRRDDAGELVPLAPAAAAGPGDGGARAAVREIDGQGYSR
ncbi:MAG: hypothetical protein QOH04_2608 [Sphingomonadales bacterium]|nr:hypothetical protein [Sphingomonadales bacterium]